MRSDSDARTGLDAVTVEIELTLISIIQGVALTFLVENARSLISFHAFVGWLYIAAGLLIILIFWSRAVLHTLTLIRWPLEYVHNFLYIICTLGEAILFTRLENPRAWFGLSAIYAVVVWVVFVVDLRMINARCGDAGGEAGARLCAEVKCDQWRNIIFLVPALFLLNVACAAAIYAHPGFFIDRRGHGLLIGASVCALLIYLIYSVRLYNRLAPLIIAMRAEWYAEPRA